MRLLLIIFVLLCAPASLGVMAWGLLLIYQATSIGVFLLCCAILSVAGLGVASLLDKRQPPPNR